MRRSGTAFEDIEGKLDSAIKYIEGRLKLIRIADKTEGGWINVDEYETSDLADDSDNEKKIRQANARALSKKQRKLQHRSPIVRSDLGGDRSLFRPYNAPRGRTSEPSDICFRCGAKGHFRRDCRVRLSVGYSAGNVGIQSIQQPMQ